MLGRPWVPALVTAALATAVLVGCAETMSRQPALVAVPIARIESVAGRWAGIAKRTPPAPSDDWVEVTISPDGTVRYRVARTIGAFLGSGTVTLSEGKLTSRSDGGSAMYVLYEGGGRRMLELEAVLTSGLRYSARLTPAK